MSRSSRKKENSDETAEIVTVNGAAICGAKLKKGGICHGKAMPNGRCRFHGGKTPVGILNPSYKHGRYSKYVPHNLVDMYDQSRNDPDALELIDEVGLVDARIADRLLDLDKEEAANATWKRLQALWKQFMFAVRTGNQEQQQLMLTEINTMVQNGAHKADVWNEITNLIESRRKLVDSEGRRLEVKQNIVTVEQAFSLVSAMVSVLKEVVYRHADPQTARRILVDASVEHQKIIGVPENSKRSGVTVE